jgi:hypothetical protein
MEHFNYDQPTDVYAGFARGFKSKAMTYRRFATGAEAIRFVIERQPAALLPGTVIEADDMRFNAEEIRELYDSEDYPLPRHQSS